MERVLREAGFQQVDAYRYNSASIRVRVIDARFAGRSRADRDALVEPHIERLPESTQADIINLFMFAPSEVEGDSKSLKQWLLNTEFDDPSPSML